MFSPDPLQFKLFSPIILSFVPSLYPHLICKFSGYNPYSSRTLALDSQPALLFLITCFILNDFQSSQGPDLFVSKPSSLQWLASLPLLHLETHNSELLKIQIQLSKSLSVLIHFLTPSWPTLWFPLGLQSFHLFLFSHFPPWLHSVWTQWPQILPLLLLTLKNSTPFCPSTYLTFQSFILRTHPSLDPPQF